MSDLLLNIFIKSLCFLKSVLFLVFFFFLNLFCLFNVDSAKFELKSEVVLELLENVQSFSRLISSVSNIVVNRKLEL